MRCTTRDYDYLPITHDYAAFDVFTPPFIDFADAALHAIRRFSYAAFTLAFACFLD